MDENYKGTIGLFNYEYGHGYIQLDRSIDDIKTILINRNSLRNPEIILYKGDRVSFSIIPSKEGIKAEDVHLIIDNYDKSYTGKIYSYYFDRGYGFIEIEIGERVFFHISNWVNKNEPIIKDSTVTFDLYRSEKGLQAKNVEVIKIREDNYDYLAQATISKDKREFEEAIRLYELGLINSPSSQLVLSYAATLKNLHRNEQAKTVFLRGIKLFPKIPKLREDLGSLLISMDEYDESIIHLEEALKLTRETNKDGGKFILTLLGKAHYLNSSLTKSIMYYEEAQPLFVDSKMPNSDIRLLEFARVRTQHPIGNITYSFFNIENFEIVFSKLLAQNSEGAEYTIEFTDSSLFRESYGLNKQILVRAYFKANISNSDLKDLDQSIKEKSSGGFIDDQVAIIIVPTLKPEFERLLWKRIEDKKGLLPSIIPLRQAEIEKEKAEKQLRLAFDHWLYRRDLYAGNRAVVGRMFFGRGKPLSEIRETVNSGTCAGIFGLRKVGKTSLLKESQRRFNELGNISIYIDLLRVPSDLHNCDWIYWRIADELFKEVDQIFAGTEFFAGIKWRLGGAFKDFLDIPQNYPVSSALDSDITQLLDALGKTNISPKPKIILLIDEIERLIPSEDGHGLSGSFDLLSYLRGVNQENENFVVVIAGANAKITEDAQFSKKDNPVFNFFREIYLPLLEKSECDTMVRELGKGMGIKYDGSALNYIFSLTGGHPFITRQLCSFIADQKTNRPISLNKDDIDKAIEFYLDIKGGDFSEILQRLKRDFPDELDALLLTSQYNNNKEHVSLSDLRSIIGTTSIKHLTGYQLIRIDNNSVVLTIELLGKWLTKEGINKK